MRNIGAVLLPFIGGLIVLLVLAIGEFRGTSGVPFGYKDHVVRSYPMQLQDQ